MTVYYIHKSYFPLQLACIRQLLVWCVRLYSHKAYHYQQYAFCCCFPAMDSLSHMSQLLVAILINREVAEVFNVGFLPLNGCNKEGLRYTVTTIHRFDCSMLIIEKKKA